MKIDKESNTMHQRTFFRLVELSFDQFDYMHCAELKESNQSRPTKQLIFNVKICHLSTWLKDVVLHLEKLSESAPSIGGYKFPNKSY